MAAVIASGVLSGQQRQLDQPPAFIRLTCPPESADVDCEALLASQPGKRDRCILYALPSGTLMLRDQSVSALANVLTQLPGRAVVDRTKLAGGFDADAKFDPQGLPGMFQLPASDQPKDVPPLDVALREALSLMLASTRAAVNVLIIDRWKNQPRTERANRRSAAPRGRFHDIDRRELQPKLLLDSDAADV